MIRYLVILVCSVFLYSIYAAPIRSALAAYNISVNKESLPYDSEVQYIESSGTQYIDTEVIMKSTVRIVGTMKVKNRNSAFGSYDSVQLTRFTSGNAFQRKAERYTLPFSLNNDGLFHSYDFSDIVILDDEIYHQFSDSVWNGTNPIYLFALCMQNKSAGDMFVGALGRTAIYEGNKIVRDFIPVRFVNEYEELEGAMFDLVTMKLFRNKGAGSFLIGVDL